MTIDDLPLYLCGTTLVVAFCVLLISMFILHATFVNEYIYVVTLYEVGTKKNTHNNNHTQQRIYTQRTLFLSVPYSTRIIHVDG